jgi:hypothetical protein
MMTARGESAQHPAQAQEASVQKGQGENCYQWLKETLQFYLKAETRSPMRNRWAFRENAVKIIWVD